MANCPLCNDTGKRMQANGQPGAYLGCSCTASLERADMHFAASKFVTEYPLGGDNLDDDLAWFIHQRAKALGCAEVLEEARPIWMGDATVVDAQAERIAELEVKLAEVQEDAERYRYLRDAHNFPQMIWDALEGIGSDTEEGYGRGMDTAIDAARNQLAGG